MKAWNEKMKELEKKKVVRKPTKRTQGMNWIRKEKRLTIYLRDGLACGYCGAGVEEGVILSLDHILPYCKGGSNSEANLITSCMQCNSARQERPAEDFAAKVAGYMKTDKDAILAHIIARTSEPLSEYKAEAAKMISRRPKWREMMAELSKPV